MFIQTTNFSPGTTKNLSSSLLSFLRCTNLYVPPHQAAADYVKAHLPEALRQQLQAFERERKESSQSYASILEQRIMAVDRDMLDKLSANHDEAGQEPGMIGGAYILGLSGDDMGEKGGQNAQQYWLVVFC